jgi:hypothetical protein
VRLGEEVCICVEGSRESDWMWSTEWATFLLAEGDTVAVIRQIGRDGYLDGRSPVLFLSKEFVFEDVNGAEAWMKNTGRFTGY